jgi:hypothetical protein
MTSRWAMDDIIATRKAYVPHLFYVSFSEFEFHRIQREIEREPDVMNTVKLDYVQTNARMEPGQFFSVQITSGQCSHYLMPGELAVWFSGTVMIFNAASGVMTTLPLIEERELPSAGA